MGRPWGRVLGPHIACGTASEVRFEPIVTDAAVYSDARISVESCRFEVPARYVPEWMVAIWVRFRQFVPHGVQ